MSEEIRSIPSRLWASFVLDMTSQKQLASWKVVASARETFILQIFPVSNARNVIPEQHLESFAMRSLQINYDTSGLPRTDFLLCIRVLNVLEQVTLCRSRTSVGQLTTTLSIAGIVESSPSWTSLLHALGLATSYDSMDTFRKGLITEREESNRVLSTILSSGTEQLPSRLITSICYRCTASRHLGNRSR